MTTLITQFGGFVGFATFVIWGVFALIGLFSKTKKGLKKEETETEDRVMNLLRGEVSELTRKVNKQDVDIKNLTDKVNTLTSENKLLTDLLQGRDGETKQFYKDAYAMMEVIKHNDKVSEENNKSLTRIVALIESYVKPK